MFKKYRILILIIIIIAFLIYYNPGQVTAPAENINIPSGLGFDIIEGNTGKMDYLVSFTGYTFNEKDKTRTMLISAPGDTVPNTRVPRQFKSDKKFIASLEKATIFGEEFCKFGIIEGIDILFANQFMNDMGWCIVSKGKAIDTLKVKVDDYPSSSDFIEGLVENCKEHNFYSDDYKIMDIYVRIDAEGRNLVLPYVEVLNDELQITGMALFKKDKFVTKIDVNEAKLMNLLREDNVRGILELKKDLKNYMSIYVDSKRKVSCQREGSKYIFTIDVSCKGDFVSNTLYNDLLERPDEISQIEKNIGQETEKQCMQFLERMKNEYKVDCLELGRAACAKYGRNTGVDWDKIVSNSEIKVNVKVKINNIGRGDYKKTK